MQALALDRGRKSLGDIEIEGVAELVWFRSPAGLDAGGEVSGIMPAEAGAPKRAQQVPQGLEAEEVEALVGDLEARLGLCVAGLPGCGRGARRVVRLVNGDEILLLHALDEA